MSKPAPTVATCTEPTRCRSVAGWALMVAGPAALASWIEAEVLADTRRYVTDHRS
jgi:hypothetical protein